MQRRPNDMPECRLSVRRRQRTDSNRGPKLDGFRILAFIRRGEVTLLTRNGNNYTSHYPWVAQDLGDYTDSEMVVDGEMAALNDKGIPDFNLMQHSAEIAIRGLRLEGEYPIVYYPFDLLHVDGKSLLNLPLHERKDLLKESLSPTDRIQLVDYVDTDGESFFKASVELGLEGMVAKRRDSIYQPGVRTKDWLKIKRVYQQDFVVGGFTIHSRSGPCWWAVMRETCCIVLGESGVVSTWRCWRL